MAFASSNECRTVSEEMCDRMYGLMWLLLSIGTRRGCAPLDLPDKAVDAAKLPVTKELMRFSGSRLRAHIDGPDSLLMGPGWDVSQAHADACVWKGRRLKMGSEG